MRLIFVIVSIVVPVIVYMGLPQILARLRSFKKDTSTLPLLIGGILFFISWYLPSPLINGENTAFTTHFIGGGVFSGFVWYYIKNALGWQPKRWRALLELASLYALVSSLGVANELFELVIKMGGLTTIPLTDTSWDLLANTLGAFAFWIAYRLFRISR